MAGEILDNKGRGEAGWEWPAIHPEGRKFGLIALGVSLFVLQCSELVNFDKLVVEAIAALFEKHRASAVQFDCQCNDCKERIEGKLNYTKGIKFAELDEQTKIVTVKYDPSKIDLMTIKQTIAKIGYDADEVKAAQEDVEKLPKCCQPKGHG